MYYYKWVFWDVKVFVCTTIWKEELPTFQITFAYLLGWKLFDRLRHSTLTHEQRIWLEMVGKNNGWCLRFRNIKKKIENNVVCYYCIVCWYMLGLMEACGVNMGVWNVKGVRRRWEGDTLLQCWKVNSAVVLTSSFKKGKKYWRSQSTSTNFERFKVDNRILLLRN